MSKSKAKVAYMEDAGEDSGSSVSGDPTSRKYALSEASPRKERPNTGKSRQRSDGSSASVSFDSDSTAHSERKAKEAKEKEASRRQVQKDIEREQRDRDRRRREKRRADEEEADRRARAEAKAIKDSKALKKTRPTSLKHAATQPIVQQNAYKRGHVSEDPSYYGVKQPAASGSRPRAQTRPASYYAGQPSRPPIANMNYHHGQQPAPFPVGTFPPPPMYGGPPMPPPSPMGPPGYFDTAMGSNQHSHLKQRFDIRPSSAMGFQTPSPMSYQHDDFDQDQGHRMARRPSRTKKQSEDRKKMPPPEFIPRPQSAAIPRTPFRPPPAPVQRPPSRHNQRPPPSHRRSVGFADQLGYDDEDFLGQDELFHDMSPDATYDQRRSALTRAHRKSGTYERDRDLMPASSRGRRGSIYGSSALGSGGVSLEDEKYLDAVKYQEDVGGSQMPLTAETLRKASKPRPSASSRSTRSSASRDESEFKRSNTTGITRSSSSNNDDVTIKLSGAAVVRVQGAEIECDGGEITFSSRPAGSRSGSDQASTIYQRQLEDARSHVERKALPHRTRAPSQSDSYSRGYAPSHAPYEPALAADNYF